ncbi:MAG TPA: hypothetical protein VGH33_20655 [Isosphaeraceae bacterium]
MTNHLDEPAHAEKLEDILEDLIPIKEAAKLLRRHIATVYRSCLIGSGPKRRKLRFVMRGRQVTTTRAWIAEYLQGLTSDRLEGSTSSKPAPAVRTPDRRRREIDRAYSELRARGM